MLSSNAPIVIALRNYPITLLLIVICVAIFLLQIISGVDVTNPSNQDLIDWGANFLPLTFNAQSYRLFTSLFLHIGFLHLLFNCFALYYFGQVAEQIVGKIHFSCLFLLAGLGGNLLSNYLALIALLDDRTLPAISAGASGSIMGIGIALLVCALFKVQTATFKLNFQSLFWIMLINLSFGFIVSGIDNAGHIGGAVTGLVLGIAYSIRYYLIKKFQSHIIANLFVSCVYLAVCIKFYQEYSFLYERISNAIYLQPSLFS